MRDVAARLARASIRVLDVRDQDYSLEDVFLVVVERSQRAQGRALAA
jgi:hypothetical protein